MAASYEPTDPTRQAPVVETHLPAGVPYAAPSLWDALTIARSAVAEASFVEHCVLVELRVREKGWGFQHHDPSRVSRHLSRVDAARAEVIAARARERDALEAYLSRLDEDLSADPDDNWAQAEDERTSFDREQREARGEEF